MSIHIVSVCVRCGSRNMSPAITAESALNFETALSLLVPLEKAQDDLGVVGCQECDPEVSKFESATEGRVRAIWDGSTTP